MADRWTYFGVEYATETLVDAAVADRNVRLTDNPTDWVVVKELSGSEVDGWVVPSQTLTDAQINNLDATKRYSVASIIDGDNDIGLTSTETEAKVLEHRTRYCIFFGANTVYKTYSPHNVDMSGYVS